MHRVDKPGAAQFSPPMNRFWLIPLVLIVLVIGPFLIWGDVLVSMSRADAATGTFGGQQVHGAIVAIGLFVADLALPIPTTSVIAGLGILYGPILGTIYAVAGSMLAALIGYGIGRGMGRPFAAAWIGDQLIAGERTFQAYGGWIVAGSRWMPVLPEVVSVVAGVSRMPLPVFLMAAFCGVLPHCAVFAVIGHLGSEQPVWTLMISALLPVALWLVLDRLGVVPRPARGGPADHSRPDRR